MDDPIQVAVPGPQTIAEDTSLTFSAANGNAFTVIDIESPRVLVALLVQDGILTLPSTAGLEFPDPESINNSPSITFYADNPAEANAALDGLIFTPNAELQRPGLSRRLGPGHDLRLPTRWTRSPTCRSPSPPVNDAPVAVDDIYAAEAGVPFWRHARRRRQRPGRADERPGRGLGFALRGARERPGARHVGRSTRTAPSPTPRTPRTAGPTRSPTAPSTASSRATWRRRRSPSRRTSRR